MSEIAAIERVARVADALSAGCMPLAEDAVAHGEALKGFLAGTHETLDEALGVAAADGQRSARTTFRFMMRDRAVVKAASLFPDSRAKRRYRQGCDEELGGISFVAEAAQSNHSDRSVGTERECPEQRSASVERRLIEER